jgi:hypothetical protein
MMKLYFLLGSSFVCWSTSFTWKVGAVLLDETSIHLGSLSMFDALIQLRVVLFKKLT